MIVEKKSKKRQKYSRAKVYSSIYHPLTNQKTFDRGDMSQFVEEIMCEIEEEVLKINRKAIQSKEIEMIVLKVLSKKTKSGMLSYLAYRESNNENRLIEITRQLLRIEGKKSVSRMKTVN